MLRRFWNFLKQWIQAYRDMKKKEKQKEEFEYWLKSKNELDDIEKKVREWPGL